MGTGRNGLEGNGSASRIYSRGDVMI